MAARKIAPALAAGCIVVLKPAAETPLTALAIARILADAGVPNGVVNLVPTTDAPAVVSTWAPGRASPQDLLHRLHPGRPRPAEAGRVQGGQRLDGTGRQRAIIVTDDADLDAAVAGAIQPIPGGHELWFGRMVVGLGMGFPTRRPDGRPDPARRPTQPGTRTASTLGPSDSSTLGPYHSSGPRSQAAQETQGTAVRLTLMIGRSPRRVRRGWSHLAGLARQCGDQHRWKGGGGGPDRHVRG